MINQAIAVKFLIASIQIIFTFGKISTVDLAQCNFAVDLLQKLAEGDKSVILSPVSVSTSLFMVYLATDGATKQQLHDVLGGTASVPEFQLYFYKFLTDSAVGESSNYTLNVANRFYVRDQYPIKDSFKRMLRFYFSESMHKFSLEKKHETVQEINNWIADKTNNKIRDMLTADSINADTYVLLMNAIYFKGTWSKQFIAEGTQSKQFHISEKETRLVPMMWKTESVQYYEDDLVKLVRMPYIGDDVEMVVILPQKRFGLSDVLRNLTGEKLLKYILDAQSARVSISLPKFRLEGKLNLNNVLERIGITDIFSEKADFGELLSEKMPISVSKVMHAGFIEVDEKGTESAAVTVIGIELTSIPLHTFTADEPFLFAVIKDLKTVLFAGHFVNF